MDGAGETQEQPSAVQADTRKEEIMARNKLNKELVNKYEEVFKSFDKEEDSGMVQIKDVPAVFRALGVTITEQEIIDLLGDKVNKEANPLHSPKIDFLDFLALFVNVYMIAGRKG